MKVDGMGKHVCKLWGDAEWGEVGLWLMLGPLLGESCFYLPVDWSNKKNNLQTETVQQTMQRGNSQERWRERVSSALNEKTSVFGRIASQDTETP